MNCVVELTNHLPAKVRVINLAPVNLTENDEATGIRLNHFVDYLLKLVAPHAGENYNGFNVCVVHYLNYPLWRHMFFDPGGVIHMVVHVDDIIFRAIDAVRGSMQHGSRCEIFQKQRLFVLGIRG